MIVVIDNYDSFTFNLVQALGVQNPELRVLRHDRPSLDKINHLAVKKIVISPGPGNPDQAGICLDVIQKYAGRVPILGVCLGHQAICQAFGGTIVKAPVPVHGKCSTIRHSGKGVFKGLANPFPAARYHSLIVDRTTLPDCLEVTAECDHLVQGIRHRNIPYLEGIQFHPESFMTDEGPALLQNFLRYPNLTHKTEIENSSEKQRGSQ